MKALAHLLHLHSRKGFPTPKSRLKALAACLVFLSLNCPALSAANIESTQTGNWNQTATWLGGVVPVAGDNATVKAGHTVTVSDAQACAGLTIQGILTVSGTGNLAQSGAASIAGTLNLQGGAISLAQVFTLTGSCNFTAGTYTFGAGGGFSGSGTVAVSGGTLTFDAGSSLACKLNLTGGTFNDNVGLQPGEVTMTSGNYQGAGSPTFANGFNWNGGILRGSGTATVSGNFTSNSGNPTLADSKELRIAGTGTITSNSARTLAFGNGSAKLTVAPTGSLTFDGSSTLGSSGGAGTLFSIENGGGLVKTGSGTLTIVPLVSLTTGSGITIDNGALVFNGASQTYTFTGGSVAITAPGSFTLDNTVSSTFNLSGISISGTGTLVASASTINVNAGTSITTKLSVASTSFNDNIGLTPGEVTLASGGNYQGTGSPTFANGFVWNSGNMAGSGIVTVSGTMSASGAGSRFIQGTKELHLSGTGILTNAGINVNSGAKLIIPNGGSLTIDLPGSTATLGNGNSAIIEVQTGGSLTKTGSFALNVFAKLLLSGGSLTISEGLFRITAAGTTHTYSGGAIGVSGTGEIQHINGSTVDISNVSISGTGTFTNPPSTTLNFNTGSSLTCKLNLTGGTFNDNVGLMPGEVTMTGGNHQGTGSPTFANGFTWNGGNIQGSGTLTMSGAMTGSSGTRTVGGSKTLRVTGAGTFAGGGVSVQSTGSLLIASGGSLSIDNAGSASIGGTGSVGMEVQAGGSFTKTGTGALTVPSIPFTNNGSLTVSSGELNISPSATHGGTFAVASGATLNFSNASTNSTLTGATFTNNGTVTVATGRSLVFGGSAQQTLAGNGTSISALTVSNSSDLNITGSQSVSGTMTLTSGKVYLQNGDLAVGTLSGAGSSRYFATFGTGRLIQSVTTAATTFPLGVSTSSYNPVTLQQVSGSADFGVNVKIGFDYPIGGPDYVNRQWTIDNTGGSPNANVTLQWNSPADEQGSFTPGNCHISRWTGAGWQSFGDAAASCGGGICIRTQAGVTQFSLFGAGSGAALPVELVDFQALPSGSHAALLSWRTASELDSEGFSIEKSADGKWFESIGFVAGAGNSSAENSYAFLDENFMASACYRLLQVDFDGRGEFSEVIFLEKENARSEVRVFPNPSADVLFVTWHFRETGNLEIELTDAAGRQALRLQIPDAQAGAESLDLAGLAPGIYFLKMKHPEMEQVQRVIVNSP